MDDAQESAVPPGEPVEPHPPRYRWLWRFVALYAALAVTVCGVRWWWGHVSGRRLAAVIHAAHAQGEKILVGDYVRGEPLADEQNSAFFIGRAEKTLRLTRTQDWAVDNATDLPLREDVTAILDGAMAENAAALADIRAARGRRADWGINVVSPMWSVLLPHLNPARRCANLSRAAAIHAMQRGDHAGAVEHVRDIQGISSSLEDANMFLITHLVTVGIDALAADATAAIAHDLEVERDGTATATVATTGAAPATASAAPATREQVRELIAALLDDSRRRTSLHRALQGERAAQLDIGLVVGGSVRMVRPAIEMDMLRVAEYGEQYLLAAAAPNLPAAQQLTPATPQVEGPRVAAHIVSESVRPALSRALLTPTRATAQSRLAAAALAIRTYQLDHGGRRPPTLDALVPAYLPVVPIDPFAAGGKPIGYVSDPVEPYVYSVGENGRDDSAGSPAWRPDATMTDPFRASDLFLRLTRKNAPPVQIDPMPEDEPDAMTPPAAPPTSPPPAKP